MSGYGEAVGSYAEASAATVRPPYRNRTATVRPPYGHRTATVRQPRGHRAATVRPPYGHRTATVPQPYGHRTAALAVALALVLVLALALPLAIVLVLVRHPPPSVVGIRRMQTPEAQRKRCKRTLEPIGRNLSNASRVGTPEGLRRGARRMTHGSARAMLALSVPYGLRSAQRMARSACRMAHGMSRMAHEA